MSAVFWQAAVAIEGVFLLIIGLLLAGVLRYLGSIQDRIDLAAPSVARLQPGDHVEPFEAPTIGGGSFDITLAASDGRGLVLLFIAPGCSSCKYLLTQLDDLGQRRALQGAARAVVVVASGAQDPEVGAQLSVVAESGATIVLDEQGTVANAYGVRVMPIGLAIDPEGVVTGLSWNPHAANWLYEQLGVDPPQDPVSEGSVGLVYPAVERRLRLRQTEDRR